MASSDMRADDIDVRLVAITYGADGINLYQLQSLDGASLPSFEPGAHIDVAISTTHRRQYSLLWPPGSAASYTVAVQVADSGRGGSKAMHYDSVVGNTYRISPPRNHFPLRPSANKHVLFAGGIGITPIVSMYRWLRKAGVPTELHYWAATRARTLFFDELSDDPNVHVWNEAPIGIAAMRVSDVIHDLPLQTQLYCCGPERMLEAFDSLCRERPDGVAHRERFGIGIGIGIGADAVLPVEDIAGFQVTLARSKQVLFVGPNETLLEACLSAGIDVGYSCEEGICGACEVSVLDGEVAHRDSVLSPSERATNKKMMICCSRAVGSSLTLDL